MIVRTTEAITGTERDIASEDGQWRSKRIVLGGDRVGFSFHETTIEPNTVNNFHYANHVEAVYCELEHPRRQIRTEPQAQSADHGDQRIVHCGNVGEGALEQCVDCRGGV
jgi:hypothetical protein